MYVFKCLRSISLWDSFTLEAPKFPFFHASYLTFMEDLCYFVCMQWSRVEQKDGQAHRKLTFTRPSGLPLPTKGNPMIMHTVRAGALSTLCYFFMLPMHSHCNSKTTHLYAIILQLL